MYVYILLAAKIKAFYQQISNVNTCLVELNVKCKIKIILQC